ncbi:hypothetical protein IX51_09895 [uncultured archaeon]|nr:hypothetical protein IX51_09895 [uncultured archaeon]
MKVENLESVSTNPRRRKILEQLPDIFHKLDPENVCREKGAELKQSPKKSGRTYVIGFGKASLKMYKGIRSSFVDCIDGAYIIVPDDEIIDSTFPELTVLEGTHPVPDGKSVSSTEKILRSLEDLNEEDTVFVLISGGGSALFESPVEGVTIEDIGKASECLMDADADIYELNTFRKFFSRVKGGRLANLLRPARVIGLVISDVFGDDLSMIASGPLTYTEYKEQDLEDIIGKYGQRCPILKEMGSKSAIAGPDSSAFTNVQLHVVLRNRDFVNEFYNTFNHWGADCINLGSDVNGDVQSVADRVISIIRSARSIKRNGFWFTFGGETTVKVRGDGQGGRNQELSLRVLKRMKDQDFLFMSIGTDGIDGKSPAMGAIVDSELRKKLTDEEIDRSIASSDSYTLLNSYNSAIITGRTGTNVSDIAVGYFGGSQRDEDD